MPLRLDRWRDRRVAGSRADGGGSEHISPSGQGLYDTLSAIVEGQPDIADSACQRLLRPRFPLAHGPDGLRPCRRPAGTLDKVGQHIEALRAQLDDAIAGTQRTPRQI